MRLLFATGYGHLPDVVGGVEEQETQVRIVLGGERRECVLEPVTRVVYDDDRDDGRRLQGVRFHDGSRLSVGRGDRWSRHG